MIDDLKTRFEAYLLELGRRLYPESEGFHAACRYALESPGKRLRPLLTMLCADFLGLRQHEHCLPAAAAVEMIHTYSLVHDDLPAMDDDDFRRGRPTTHKVFGEADAILVGDALLTDAFAVLAGGESIDASTAASRLREIGILAAAAGGSGMVLGQALDIRNEGESPLTAGQLDGIHRLKTGRLFAACCGLGASRAGSKAEVLADFLQAGSDLGLAFQIQDDMLDDHAGTGKSTGKDRQAGKQTFTTLFGKKELAALLESKFTAVEAAFSRHGSASHPLFGLLARLRSRRF